jgi:hypothetical protein
LRPDGGYVLVINAIDGEGALDSEYLNPRKINVSQARASIESDQIKIFVELKDKYYPGNYYELFYDDENDRLSGTYYHLGLNQEFDIYFVRQKTKSPRALQNLKRFQEGVNGKD